MGSIRILEHHGKLDEVFLKALEKSWGFKLPSSYRLFLLTYNGGIPDCDCFKFNDNRSDLRYFYGIHDDEDSNLLYEYQNVYKDRIPDNCFPIACDSFGNLILISVKGPDRGKIYFWDHEEEAYEDEEPDYSNLTLIADNFDEFLDGLHDYEEE